MNGLLAAFLLSGLALHSVSAQTPSPTSATVKLPILPGARVTVLVDNLALDPPLAGEHGAAFVLETGQHRVLYDTGTGKTILENAQTLGVSLRSLDAIIISHGHADHTGGLVKVLSSSGPVRLLAHPMAFEAHFIKDGGSGLIQPFGLPLTRAQLVQQGVTIVETKGPTEICPGVMVTGEIPRSNTFEDTGARDYFFLDPEAKTLDPILDDQTIFYRVSEGVVVITGCGHAGVVNTLDYVCQLLGESSIYAVIGGIHLLSASPERTKQTLQAFQRLQVKKIFLSHCTGARANAKFEETFPGQCQYPSVGTRLIFGTFKGN